MAEVEQLLRPFQEKTRQKHFINLIPSENFTSQAVLDALGSVMQSMWFANGATCNADSNRQFQTNTPRDTPVLGTMVEMSTLTLRSVCASSVPWKPSDSTRRNGV